MQDDFNLALAKALKKLKTSDRFESEVRVALHEFDPSTTDRVIAHLRDKGIVSDARAARQVAMSERASGLGSLRLAADLERRGAPEELISQVLPDGETERSNIRALLQKRFKDSDDRGRVGRFLVSRGFSEEDIEAELEHFFAGGA